MGMTDVMSIAFQLRSLLISLEKSVNKCSVCQKCESIIGAISCIPLC